MNDLASTDDCDGGVEPPEQRVADFEFGANTKEDLLPALYHELRQIAACHAESSADYEPGD